MIMNKYYFVAKKNGIKFLGGKEPIDVSGTYLNVSKNGGKFFEDCIEKNGGGITTVELPEELTKYTVSFWCYFYDVGGWRYIINHVWLKNNTLMYFFKDDSSSYEHTGTPILTNKWYHCYIAVDGNKQEFYIDGTKFSNDKYSQKLKTLYLLGFQQQYHHDNFNGKISDICIFDDYIPFESIPTEPLGITLQKVLYIKDNNVYYIR